jgi:hypothetical protein
MTRMEVRRLRVRVWRGVQLYKKKGQFAFKWFKRQERKAKNETIRAKAG